MKKHNYFMHVLLAQLAVKNLFGWSTVNVKDKKFILSPSKHFYEGASP